MKPKIFSCWIEDPSNPGEYVHAHMVCPHLKKLNFPTKHFSKTSRNTMHSEQKDGQENVENLPEKIASTTEKIYPKNLSRTSEKSTEWVEHPQHYNTHPSGVECIHVIEHFPFNVGTAMKHLWRAGLKPGSPVLQDLEKAKRYIDFEIERIKRVDQKS